MFYGYIFADKGVRGLQMSQDENYKSAALGTAWCYRTNSNETFRTTHPAYNTLNNLCYKPVEKNALQGSTQVKCKELTREVL